MPDLNRGRSLDSFLNVRPNLTVGAVGKGRGFALFAAGFIVYLLHMLFPMSAIGGYATAAAGALAMLCSAFISRPSKRKMDLVAVLLVARAIWLTLVNLVVGGGLDYFANGAYFSAILSIFVYMGCRSYSADGRSSSLMTTGMLVLFVVVFAQVAFYYIQLGSFGDFRTNKYMVSIPFGESNAIAMGYIAIGLYLVYVSKVRLQRVIIIVLMIAGSVLLASTGSLVSLGLIAVCLALGSLDPNKQLSHATLLLGCFVFIMLTVVVVNIMQGGSIAALFASTIEKIEAFLSGNYASASTNRTYIYTHYFNLFCDSPVIGYGTVPVNAVWGVVESYRPHNWVLEALIQGGFANLFFFTAACVLGFKNSRRDGFSRACCILAAYLLIDSLFEPGVFGINKDFLLWCALGFSAGRDVRS